MSLSLERVSRQRNTAPSFARIETIPVDRNALDPEPPGGLDNAGDVRERILGPAPRRHNARCSCLRGQMLLGKKAERAAGAHFEKDPILIIDQRAKPL